MTPEQLEAFRASIEKLRLDALFGDDSEASTAFSLDAEQHYLLALSALETAHRFATLALYAQRQGR